MNRTALRTVVCLAALALVAGCSGGSQSGTTTAPTTSETTATTAPPATSVPATAPSTTNPVPTSTVVPTTSTTPVTTTTRAPGAPFPSLQPAATVVPAFVVFVAEGSHELAVRPTLGDATARVVHRAAEGLVLDGVAVLPDGREAIVGERTADASSSCRASLQRIDLATGAARELVAGATAPVMSADGAWLAYTAVDPGSCARGRLVLRDAASGATRTLTDVQPRAAESAAWSPDAARLAFTDCAGTCHLRVLDTGNGETVDFGTTGRGMYQSAPGAPITVLELAVAAPVGWHANGTLRATGRCACDADGAAMIGTWDRDAPALYPMLLPERERTIAFAGDNELVVTGAAGAAQTVYRRHGDGPLVDLGVRTDGTATWPVGLGWHDALPAAADGRPATILTVVRGAVVDLESATGAVVRVRYRASGGYVEAAAVDARNGRLFAGVSRDGCAADLVSVPLDGGAPTVIGAGLEPSLSPDGTTLAYVASLWARTGTAPPSPQGIGCAYSVVVVRDLRTGAEHQLLPPGFVPGDPSTGSWEAGAVRIRWSPDGRRLAYVIGYEGGSSYVADANATTTRLLGSTPAVDAVLRERLQGYPEMFVVAWTADGLHLSASCYGCGVSPIHVRSHDGTAVDEIVTTPYPPLDVRDGHALVADEPGDRPAGLARVTPDGTTVLLRLDTSQGTWR